MSTRADLLVVDDEPDMGLITRALGKRFGWRVEHRLEAPSAWECLQQYRPDLVLLDVRLPGVSGPELCRRIRKEPRLADLRLAIFTTGTIPEDVAEGLEAGAPYLVNKELICRPDAWRERVAEIVASPSGRGLIRPLTWTPGPLKVGPLDSQQAALPEILEHPKLRGLGQTVLRALVRSALRQAFGPDAVENPLLEKWLFSESSAKRSCHWPPELGSQSITVLSMCLAEQLWCFLGESASADVRVVLLAGVTGLVEGPACR